MTPSLRHSQNPLVLHEYLRRLVTLSQFGFRARCPKINPAQGEFVGGKNGFTSDQVANFGSGKRECLGKLMAEKQMFLFFAGLLHKFEFCQEPGTQLPDVSILNDEKNRMYIRRPPHYNVVLKKRC